MITKFLRNTLYLNSVEHKMTNQMPERIYADQLGTYGEKPYEGAVEYVRCDLPAYFQMTTNGLIRKWQHEPFAGGVKYVPEADLAQKTVTREELEQAVFEGWHPYRNHDTPVQHIVNALIQSGVVKVSE